MEWMHMRALRKKYRQLIGAAQGAQFVVGLTQLLGNKDEHDFYSQNPAVMKEVTRWRWLDDMLV